VPNEREYTTYLVVSLYFNLQDGMASTYNTTHLKPINNTL